MEDHYLHTLGEDIAFINGPNTKHSVGSPFRGVSHHIFYQHESLNFQHFSILKSLVIKYTETPLKFNTKFNKNSFFKSVHPHTFSKELSLKEKLKIDYINY